MSDFKVSLKTIGLRVLHCGLYMMGAIVIALIFVLAWLQYILAPLPLVIANALPEQYGRALLLLADALPSHTDDFKRKAVD